MIETIVDLHETSQNADCLFDWFDYQVTSQSTIFQLFHDWTSTNQGLMCPASENNTVRPEEWE